MRGPSRTCAERALSLLVAALLGLQGPWLPFAHSAATPEASRAATCAAHEIPAVSRSSIASGVGPNDSAVVRPGTPLCVRRARETVDTAATAAPQLTARVLEDPSSTRAGESSPPPRIVAVTRAQIEDASGRNLLPAPPPPAPEGPRPEPRRAASSLGSIEGCGGTASFNFGHLRPAGVPPSSSETPPRPDARPSLVPPNLVLLPRPEERAPTDPEGNPSSAAASDPIGGVPIGVTNPAPESEVPPLSGVDVNQGTPVLGSRVTEALDSSLRPSREAARIDRQVTFLDSVLTAKRGVEEAARRDEQALAAPYREMNLPQLKSALAQAEQALTAEADTLAQAQEGLLHGDIARFQRVYANARDKASAGQALIQEELSAQDPTLATSLLPALFQRSGGTRGDFNPLGATQKLAELFGFGSDSGNETSAAARAQTQAERGVANTSERLVNRLVLLNGLPDQRRRAVVSQLSLAEPTRLTLADGTIRDLTILHNGYLMGGGKTGLDCSSLVSATLPEEVRNSRLTTLDLRSIWVYRWTGRMPAPPRYELEESKKLKSIASAFDALDIYSRQPLQPGDLLVYRTLWQATGHVFIVRNFDPAHLSATVLEAAQSGAGTIRERDFALSLDPPSARARQLRAGLYLLRLRPTRQTVCRYDAHRNATSPAAPSPPRENSGKGSAR